MRNSINALCCGTTEIKLTSYPCHKFIWKKLNGVGYCRKHYMQEGRRILRQTEVYAEFVRCNPNEVHKI